MSDAVRQHPASAAPSDRIAAFRAEFAVTRTMAYFANGSITPAASSVVAAQRDWQERWTADPQVGYRRYPQLLERLRASLADLIGCDPDEVAITDNTSRGSILAVRALAGRDGSHVLADRTTYPSSRYPWLALTGKSVVHVDDDAAAGPDALVSRIGPETCAVSISHVDWFTGVRHDLETIAKAAHRNGALLVVDGSQSVGAVPVDVRRAGIDVLVGTFGKWLMGGPGLGFIYMNRRLLEAAPMVEPGWRNFTAKGHAWPMETMPERAAGARIFEPGLPNIIGLVAAQAGLELVARTGVDTIASEIAGLTGRIREGLAEIGMPLLTPQDAERRAGLLAFPLADAPALAAHLRERGVEITGYPYGHVRIDPHAYNTVGEAALLLEAVRDYVGQKGRGNG